MSRANTKNDKLAEVLFDMFGSEHCQLIQEAIEKCKRDTETATTEDAIECMFELMRKSPTKAAAATPSMEETTKSNGYLPENFEKVINMIERGYKVLVLLRGLPGSGKSYLAKEIMKRTGFSAKQHVFSTDDYFYDANGRYNYDVTRLSESHSINQSRTKRQMRDGWSPVIIDNTNLKVWEMIPYVRMAIEHHYVVEILEPVTPWATKAGQLQSRNQHNVPKEKIRRMYENYEKTTVKNLLQSVDRESHMSLEPALRHHPPLSQPEPFNAKPQREVFNGKTAAGLTPTPSTSQEQFCWNTFEQDNFWDKYKTETSASAFLPKPPKTTTEPKPPRDNLLKTLKEATIETTKPEPPAIHVPETQKLEKHRVGCPNENQTFRSLSEIFSTIGTTVLWDLFEKCGGDSEWVSDLLFQDETAFETSNAGEKDRLNCDCDNQGATAIPQPKPISVQASSKKSKPNKNKRNKIDAATKRALENAVVIGDEHYSNHTQTIRNLRHPKPEVELELDDGCSTPESDEVGSCHGEEEFVEVNLGNDLVQRMEKMFGINALGVDTNGDLVLGDLKLHTTVFMQKSLANQIYALWCESLYNQLEGQRQSAIREDLETARQLDAKEKYPGLFMDAPKNFKDIIDIELSLAAYKQDIAKWKTEIPDTMATRLARDKMRKIFPNLDAEVLDEMLAAHRNDVNQTIETLKAQVNIDETLIHERSRELFAQAQSEIDELSTGFLDFERDEDNYKLNDEDSKRAALRAFQECRNIAQHHHQLKAECHVKAKNANDRGLPDVALYYAQIAALHKTKIDFYNHKAANSLMEAHNFGQGKANMLDLHYLHSNEAIECLDLFIDKHINALHKHRRPHTFIFIITGRGLRSKNGVPAIKIRVKQRLETRGLRCSEANPGLLQIKLHTNSKFTYDI